MSLVNYFPEMYKPGQDSVSKDEGELNVGKEITPEKLFPVGSALLGFIFFWVIVSKRFIA
jgi:hypothetical protein